MGLSTAAEFRSLGAVPTTSAAPHHDQVSAAALLIPSEGWGED